MRLAVQELPRWLWPTQTWLPFAAARPQPLAAATRLGAGALVEYLLTARFELVSDLLEGMREPFRRRHGAPARTPGRGVRRRDRAGTAAPPRRSTRSTRTPGSVVRYVTTRTPPAPVRPTISSSTPSRSTWSWRAPASRCCSRPWRWTAAGCGTAGSSSTRRSRRWWRSAPTRSSPCWSPSRRTAAADSSRTSAAPSSAPSMRSSRTPTTSTASCSSTATAWRTSRAARTAR